MSRRAWDVVRGDPLASRPPPPGSVGPEPPADGRLRRRQSICSWAGAAALCLVLLPLLSTMGPYARHGGPILLQLTRDHAVHLIDPGIVVLVVLAVRRVVPRFL